MPDWQEWRNRAEAGARATLRRLRRSSRRDAPAANVLAISDLHLGNDLRREQAPRDDVPRIDLALAALLDHYAAHREDGLPWRLLVVGDAVDFIGIGATPAPGEAPFPVRADERLHGLDPEPAKTEWKLRAVFARHPRVFAAFARFVAAGHELVVIRGNHDPEWCFPSVQTALRDHLASLALPAGPLPLQRRARFDSQQAAFRRRITFRDWFYLEPGRLYVEHGHHYDEYSVTSDLMRAPDSPRALSEPISTMALRYFSNKHGGLDEAEVESWTIWDYLRWGIRRGQLLRGLADYLAMCGRLLAFSAKASLRTAWRSVRRIVRVSRDIAVEDEKLAHLRAMLVAVRDDHEQLATAIGALLKPPAEASVAATASMLYFDRIALAAGTTLGVVACLATPLPLWGRIVAMAVVAGLGLLANARLARTRTVESHPKLLAAAHRISVLFDVPCVIMGHSHRAVDTTVGDGARYFNLGTWVSPSVADMGASYPHAVVTTRGPQLRRWPANPAKHEVA